jgi:hypothetical protein
VPCSLQAKQTTEKDRPQQRHWAGLWGDAPQEEQNLHFLRTSFTCYRKTSSPGAPATRAVHRRPQALHAMPTHVVLSRGRCVVRNFTLFLAAGLAHVAEPLILLRLSFS